MLARLASNRHFLQCAVVCLVLQLLWLVWQSPNNRMHHHGAGSSEAATLVYGPRVPTLFEEHLHDTEWSLGSGAHVLKKFAPPNGKTLSRNEIESTVSNLLAAFQSFASEHNLTYWLTHGSLLGAQRDQRIVPWDNDADVGMTESDLERMIEALRDGASYPGHDEIVTVRRFGPDTDCIAVKFIDSTNGLYVDVMPFSDTYQKRKQNLLGRESSGKRTFRSACTYSDQHSIGPANMSSLGRPLLPAPLIEMQY